MLKGFCRVSTQRCVRKRHTARHTHVTHTNVFLIMCVMRSVNGRQEKGERTEVRKIAHNNPWLAM